MAVKQTKSKKKTKRVPTTFNIDVNVDPTTGAFSYVIEETGLPAKSIRPRNGDTVSWRVRLGGLPVPFQIEFGIFNPFGPGRGVIRSLFGRSRPGEVNLPRGYTGNLVFQYRVSIPNGWSDDPDVQPVTSDGDVVPLAVPNTILLSIDRSGNLTLSNSAASFPKGEVQWKWSGDPVDDFNLTFDPKVPPWPRSTDSAEQRIVINFPVPTTPGPHPYRISTETTNQEVEGTLEITP